MSEEEKTDRKFKSLVLRLLIASYEIKYGEPSKSSLDFELFREAKKLVEELNHE